MMTVQRREGFQLTPAGCRCIRCGSGFPCCAEIDPATGERFRHDEVCVSTSTNGIPSYDGGLCDRCEAECQQERTVSEDFEAPGYVWRDGAAGRQIGIQEGAIWIWHEDREEPMGHCYLPVRDPIEMASILTAIAEEAGLEVVQPIVLRDPEAERVDVLDDSLDELEDHGKLRNSDAGEELLAVLRRRGFELVRRAS